MGATKPQPLFGKNLAFRQGARFLDRLIYVRWLFHGDD